MQARDGPDGARPLLLLFLRQTLAPAGVLLLGKFLERLAALCGGPLLDARIDAIALQGDLVFAGLVARAAQRQYVAGRAVAVADPGELHLRPFAVKVGEAEGPHPITALAHDQIKPPAVRMNASLQRFTLVRIECHFNVPFRLPLTVTDASLATVSRSKIDLSWMYDRHGYFGRESSVNLPLFRQKRPAFGDFGRSQTTADAANNLKLQVNISSDDGQ